MTKNLTKVKTSVIMGLMLFSMFSLITPQVSGGVIVNLESVVNLYEYNTNLTNIPIQPRATGFSTDVTFEYYVTYAGGILNLLGESILAIHKGRTAQIQVEAFGHPSWATVTISNWPIVRITDESQYPKITLTVKLNEDAPAFGEGEIKLRVTVPKEGLVQGIETVFGFSFSAGYLPLVQAQFPGGESKIIGPMDTAVFPIELQNLGNARTRVTLEVQGVPDGGWAAIITNDVIIEEGEGSKAMAYLTVKPPKGFGYHDDVASIIVTYTAEMAENPIFIGETRTVDVLVESRGFSIIGGEIVLIPLIIIILIVLLIYYFVIKKR